MTDQAPHHTLTFVSHTHWDREWYRTFEQYRIRLVQLIDKLLDLLEADPDYLHFMLDGQTIILDDYLAIRPEQRPRLEALIRSGRLQIGPWYILPDEFLVAPESTIRNLLVGAAACADFGARMAIGNIPDPFGHISQMPQLLRGFDIDAMAFWRGVSGAPNEFLWAAPDGTAILVIHQTHGYGNAASMPSDPDAFIARTEQIVAALAPTATTAHLLAMNGSDHEEPQPELPRLLRHAAAALPDVAIRHGTLPQFVAAVREAAPQLATYHGEMRDPAAAPLLPGVLSARMWIKQRNHAAETLLTAWAEPFSALAELAGAPLELTRQSALVRHAWRILLRNHPHDSICGCSIDQVHREMAIRFDRVDQIGEELTERNLQALARLVTTDGPAVVVFNPTTHPRTDAVTLRVPIPADDPALVLETAAGETLVPRLTDRRLEVAWDLEVETAEMRTLAGYMSGHQLLGDDIHAVTFAHHGPRAELEIRLGQGPTPDPDPVDRAIAQLHAALDDPALERVHILVHHGERIDCTFVAPDVPGLGYRTYRLRPTTTPAPHPAAAPADLAIENAALRVAVDPDGTFTLTDKATGRRYPGLHRFVDVGDRGDEYNFCPVEHDLVVASPVAPPQIRRLDTGPVHQTLEIAQTYRLPAALDDTRAARSAATVDLAIVSRLSLVGDLPRVEIATTVDNVAADHRLRVHLPLPFTVDTFTTDGHLDLITRPLDLPTGTADWVEQPVGTHPQRAWADVSDGDAGLLLANRGLPEVEALRTPAGTELALTLLRCVGWLSRGDLSVRRGHAGPGLPTPEAQCPGTHTFHYALVPHAADRRPAVDQAHAFNTPLRAVATGPHAGDLPPARSFVTAEPTAFIVSAVKEADDGDGLIVRLWNSAAAPADAAVRFWRTPARLTRCTLAERDEEELTLDPSGAAHLTARPRQILTLRARF